ncbi:MAG: carbohydrate kinase family protein [Jatrophihabitantaceae bacterium]
MADPVLAVIGEALIDLVHGADGTATPRPGGSPLNVAIGLARLHQPTAFLGRFGGDEYGRLLRAHAADSGVDLRRAIAAAEPSTVAAVHLDDHGAAQYEFTVEGTADFAWTDGELTIGPSVRVVHFGSLASWLPPGDAVVARRIAELNSAGAAVISYDPNVRPHLQPDAGAARAQVEGSLRHAHVVKASDEDVRYLYGDEPVADVARRWQASGPGLVVITRGADGPLALANGTLLARPSFPIELVDTVGAGDAFTSGLLDALVRRDVTTPERLIRLTGSVLADVLDEGALVAAITCSRAGANPPTRAELISVAAR